MPELARQRIGTVKQLAVEQQPDANPFGDRHRHEIPDIVGMASEPQLRECAGARGVLEHDRQVKLGLEEAAEIHLAPAEIGCEQQRAGLVDASGEAHAHAFVEHPAMRVAERGDSARKLSREVVRSRWCGPVRLHDESRVEPGEPDPRGAGSQIDRDDAGPLDVQVQETWTASARGDAAGGTFSDPPLANELIDDRGHGAALQAGSAREIGPRHRLMTSDDVERDAPVDVTRGLTGGESEIGEIDLAHVSCGTGT